MGCGCRGFSGELVAKSVCGDSPEEIQQKLADLGYYKGPIDGQASPAYLAAVAQFMSDKGLTFESSEEDFCAALDKATSSGLEDGRGDRRPRRRRPRWRLAPHAKEEVDVLQRHPPARRRPLGRQSLERHGVHLPWSRLDLAGRPVRQGRHEWLGRDRLPGDRRHLESGHQRLRPGGPGGAPERAGDQTWEDVACAVFGGSYDAGIGACLYPDSAEGLVQQSRGGCEEGHIQTADGRCLPMLQRPPYGANAEPATEPATSDERSWWSRQETSTQVAIVGGAAVAGLVVLSVAVGALGSHYDKNPRRRRRRR